MTFFTRAVLAGTLVLPLATVAQVAPSLFPYTVCKFDDGLAVSDTTPLPNERVIDIIGGKKTLKLVQGERVLFSYPNTDFFADVKVEELPEATFVPSKKALIANFDRMLASGDDRTRNMTYALKPTLNGFDIRGLDRSKFEGRTLGIYLLIDDRTHIATTIYLLNSADATRRKFASLDEYAKLRDHFLNAYTSCVRKPTLIPRSAGPGL